MATPPPRTTRRRRATTALLPLLLVGLLAGCGDDPADDDTARGDGADTTQTTGGPTVDESSSSTAPSPRTGQTDAAVADLAARIGVDPSEITVVSADAVTWRDSSLGCPQRGFQYLQVLTEGVRIVLEVDGTTYHYHGGASGDPSYCATPEAPQSVG